MKIELAPLNPDLADALRPEKNDRSGVGVHYADAYLKPLKKKIDLPDGTKFSAKRRGLKITLAWGTNKGEGLLRRIENGPDPVNMVNGALAEAGEALGAKLVADDGKLWLEHEATS
jgi:predicted DNA-binding antitoxin AbrB/MazE fold protein